MNILDVIMNAQGGNTVRQAGAQVGLSEAETATALSALVPALAAGFQRNMQSPDGLTGLLGALTGGGHQRYIDDPTALTGATADGNGILGHVLGGKDVSRALADRASSQTGISPDVLKQLLPIAASLMMGAFSRQHAQGGLSMAAGATPGASSGGLMDLLTPLVDRNRDGSIIDDVGGMIGKVFGGR
ncbi:MAG: DUF937 domain-containing protein [Vicinamibacteraceae bacterium]